MPDLYVVTATVAATTLLALYILRRAGVPLLSPTPTTIFIGLYVLLNSLGGPFLYGGFIKRWHFLNQDAVLKVIFLSQSCLLIMSLTILFWSRFAWLSVAHNYRFTPLMTLTRGGKLMALAFLGLSALVIALYLARLPGIPVLAAAQGQVLQAAFLRSEATNAFTGSFAAYQFIFESFLPVIACIFLANWVRTRSKSDLMLAGLGLLGAAAVPIVLITKGGMFEALIMVIATYFLACGKPVSVRFMLGGLFVIALLLMALFYVTLGVGTFELNRVFEAVADRLFVGNMAVATVYVQTFPAKLDYLMGASFPNPGHILQHVPVALNKLGYRYVFASENQQFNTEIVGTAASVFWTDGYANFGILGALSSAIAVGTMVYGLAAISIRTFQRSPVNVAMMAWLGTHLGRMAQTFFMPFLFDTDLVMMAVLLFAIHMVDNGFRWHPLDPQSGNPAESADVTARAHAL
jgi:hypothetical protein